MVIGLFDAANHAAVCLSNLAEQDFAPADISVIRATAAEARAMADVSGPLNALTPDDLAPRLRALGLSAADADQFRHGAQQGGVVIAVSAAEADDAAAETFRDHGATAIRVAPRT